MSVFCSPTDKISLRRLPPGGHFHIRRSGGLAPNFASEILVGAPNFASKNINDKYPKFCPLNFRCDPKIGTFSQLVRLVVTKLPKFFLSFGEPGRTLPPHPPPPPTSLLGSTPPGRLSSFIAKTRGNIPYL